VAARQAKLASRVDGAGGRNYSACDCLRPGISLQSVESLSDLTDADSARRICVATCSDGVSCRIFLCGCCRSQVLVCRCCDRGQIYCINTCAQKVRAERQREARCRYQATPRGRAMHAERNRRSTGYSLPEPLQQSSHQIQVAHERLGLDGCRTVFIISV
jgi:hypothetical protein